LFDSASIITAASLDYIRNSVISPYFQVNREKFEEIPFGVEAEKFSPVQPGICRGKVLFVGALDKAHDFKGLEILMAAMGGLERSIRLIIVGDGDLRGYYERMALNYGLRERIDFAGRVADNALPDYYRQAAVTVLPSLNSHEAFGLVLLESMACGTPVIASDLPGVRRVFLPGREGLLVKAGDSEGLRSKINDLLADNKRRENMGRAGRLLVLEKYDWRQVGEKINKLYQKAASL
jgi:glycosyltransferase involved in cell wall biosynthesis